MKSEMRCGWCKKFLIPTRQRPNPKYCNVDCYKAFQNSFDRDQEKVIKMPEEKGIAVTSVKYALIANMIFVIVLILLSINTQHMIKEKGIKRNYYINMREILD